MEGLMTIGFIFAMLGMAFLLEKVISKLRK